MGRPAATLYCEHVTLLSARKKSTVKTVVQQREALRGRYEPHGVVVDHGWRRGDIQLLTGVPAFETTGRTVAEPFPG